MKNTTYPEVLLHFDSKLRTTLAGQPLQCMLYAMMERTTVHLDDCDTKGIGH